MNSNGTFGRNLERWLDDRAWRMTGLHEVLSAPGDPPAPRLDRTGRGRIPEPRGASMSVSPCRDAIIGVLAVGGALYLVPTVGDSSLWQLPGPAG
jgi:hypothetical protein